MAKKIRMVATDLDGTFMDGFDSVHPDNIRALEACEAAGIPVCCITARAYHLAKRPLALGKFRGLCVTSNGSGIHDVQTGRAHYQLTMPQQTLYEILKICKGENVHVGVTGAYYGVDCRELYDPEDIRIKNNYMNAQWPIEQRHDLRTVDTIEQLADAMGDTTQSIWIQNKTPDELPGRLYRAIISTGEFLLTSSHPGGLDVLLPQAGKRNGLARLAEMMGVAPEEVMVCGDHFNDLGMMHWAGLSVAMGNADARVRAEADYVSRPNDQGGVADAIERFILHA